MRAALLLLFPVLAHAAVPVVPDNPKSAEAARVLATALSRNGVPAAVTDNPVILACLDVDAARPGLCLTLAAKGPVVLVGSATVGKRVAVTVDAWAPPEGQRVAEDAWKGTATALPGALGKLGAALAKKLKALPPPPVAATPPEAPLKKPVETPAEVKPKEPEATAVVTPPPSDAPRVPPALTPHSTPPPAVLTTQKSNTASWVALGTAGAAAAAAIGLGISTGVDGARLNANAGGVSDLSYTEAQATAARGNATLGAAIGTGVAAVACAVLAWALWESP